MHLAIAHAKPMWFLIRAVIALAGVTGGIALAGCTRAAARRLRVLGRGWRRFRGSTPHR